MGQVIPVNRFSCAANVRGRGYAQATFDGRFGGIFHSIPSGPINRRWARYIGPYGGLGMKFIPTGAVGYSFETFAKGATGDAQAINSTRIRFNQVAAT